MSRLIEWILSIPIIVLTFGFIMVFVLTQWNMTKEDKETKLLKKASYKDFRDTLYERLDSVSFNNNWPSSIFSTDGTLYIHADIFRVNEVGYLMTPLGYILSKILISRTIKNLPDYPNKTKPYI